MSRVFQTRFVFLIIPLCILLTASCSKAGKSSDLGSIAPDAKATPAPEVLDAGQVLAKISYLEEPVALIRSELHADARLGDALTTGDVLTTGANGRCSIEIAGIGTLELAEKSSLRIDGVILAERRGAVSLAAGSLTAKVKQLASPDAFAVRAGSIVCGVRGTEFTVSRRVNGAVSLSVAKGRVSVFPDALITSGLHATATVVSVRSNAVASELTLDSIMKELPTVDAGTSLEISPRSFENAGRVIETESVRFAKEGSSDSSGALIEALRDIGAYVERSTESEDATGDSRDRKARSGSGPGYTYSVMPIEAPTVREEPGDFWPRPEALHARVAERTVRAPMDASSALLIVNEKAAGKASTSFSEGRAYIEILQNNANEWLALVENRAPVPLSKDAVYLLEFTAWTPGNPMRVYACLNEGGRDDNGDGDPYTAYISRLVPVDSLPRRYGIVYQYRGVDNSQARFNVSAGNTTGGVNIQDISVVDLNARPLSAESDGGNLVRNGDFSRGFLGWDLLDNASFDLSMFSVVRGRLRYSQREKFSERWHAQACAPVSLTKGKKYRLSFDARLSGSGALTIGLEEYNVDRNRDGNRFSPEAPYIDIEPLDDGWSMYAVDFTATASDPRARLTFNFGGLAGTLLIDNVSLVKQ